MKSREYASSFRDLLPVIVVAMLCIVVIVAVIIFRDDDRQLAPSTTSESPSESLPSPAKVSGSDSAELSKDKSGLTDQVKAFVEIYFAVDLTQSSADITRRLQPYVTQSFLQDASIGLGTSAADEAIKKEGASIRVQDVSAFYGELTDDGTAAEGTVEFRLAKFNKHGNRVNSFAVTATLVLVKENSEWRVSAVETG